MWPSSFEDRQGPLGYELPEQGAESAPSDRLTHDVCREKPLAIEVRTHWVITAKSFLFLAVLIHCGMWASLVAAHRFFSRGAQAPVKLWRVGSAVCSTRAPECTGSRVAVQGFTCPVACRISVPRPGIKPTPPAVEAWRPNHWTTREVPSHLTSLSLSFLIYTVRLMIGTSEGCCMGRLRIKHIL